MGMGLAVLFGQAGLLHVLLLGAAAPAPTLMARRVANNEEAASVSGLFLSCSPAELD
jgi:hypothetical protein